MGTDTLLVSLLLTTAAAAWRSSLDGSLEGLSEAITQEVADRIAAITAEEQRVDALIASGMWLFADQAAFPDCSRLTMVVWCTATLTAPSSMPTAGHVASGCQRG